MVVGCSDSRVPPELVFNVSLGDIFVVRTAGEVVDKVPLGSIEYAVEHWGTHFLVLVGHQHCGAVSAAAAEVAETGDIPNVLRAISPAIEETKGQSGDLIENAVRANARDIAKRLQSAGPIIAPRVQSGKVKVVAAYYSLDTGQVELLESMRIETSACSRRRRAAESRSHQSSVRAFAAEALIVRLQSVAS